MGGKRILSDAQIDEMAMLRESGWSIPRIAEHFTANGTTISPGSISWQCLRVGADAPPRLRGKHTQPKAYCRNGRAVRPFTPDDDALLLQIEGDGRNYSEIGRKLNRPPNSVRGRLMVLARRDARAAEA